jgi:nitric oxide dioxygenase
MLSAQAREVVQATLPAVGAALGEITPLFYRKMFAEHPELERNLFNRGNQQRGEQQQALGKAIARFAVLQLDSDPTQEEQLLGRIAHKHASLGITAEQYHIVHTHLFAAIVEVLGDAVTAEVAAAWDELYWLLAQALISKENGLYADAGVTAGDVWRRVLVNSRSTETADSLSFTVTSLGGEPLPTFTPGQYISVAVQLPDGARQIRQYSLCSAPSAGVWRFTVKRIGVQVLTDASVTPVGEVSNFLYDNLFEGDFLDVSRPFGDVVLPDNNAPLLLVSAGIGCTPIIGMLDHLAENGDARPITVLHADRSPSTHAHRAQLSELVDSLPSAALHRWYEDMGSRPPSAVMRVGRIDLTSVDVLPGTQAYLCGPLPFMRGIRATLLAMGLNETDIHYEVFGPDSWSPTAT